MKSDNNDEVVEIFAGTAINAEILKSILMDSEIEAYLKDEYMGTIAPWQAAPGGAGAVKLVILGRDYEKAKLVVDEYLNNLRPEAR